MTQSQSAALNDTTSPEPDEPGASGLPTPAQSLVAEVTSTHSFHTASFSQAEYKDKGCSANFLLFKDKIRLTTVMAPQGNRIVKIIEIYFKFQSRFIEVSRFSGCVKGKITKKAV